MKINTSILYQWFKEYNHLIFYGELSLVPITLNNTRRQLGQFYYGKGSDGRGKGIKISTYYDRPEDEYRNTLVHEMCHLWCYKKGWIGEHHGKHWKAIAERASRITGLPIQRVHYGAEDWEVASKNKGREKAIKAKKEAPSLLVVLEYPTYYFVVKTTANVLMKDDSTTWDCKLRTSAKWKVYISDDAFFKKYQPSRSIHRGYKYGFLEYQNKVAPKLKGAKEVNDLGKLFRGGYDAYLR